MLSLQSHCVWSRGGKILKDASSQERHSLPLSYFETIETQISALEIMLGCTGTLLMTAQESKSHPEMELGPIMVKQGKTSALP